jgi:hypothetical protein
MSEKGPDLMHRCFPALLLVPMLAGCAECAVHNVRRSLGAFLLTVLAVGCGAQSPSATPEPTLEVPFAVSGPVSGPGTIALAAGTYRMRGPGESPAGWPSSVVVSVPDQWWGVSVLRGSGLVHQHEDGSYMAELTFNSVEHLFADPCATPVPGRGPLLEPPLGTSVDDLVAGLRSLPGLQFTEEVEVTLDGWDGKRLELAQPIQCDEAPIGLTPAVGGESWTINIRGGWATALWILDVDGLRFVVMASYEPGTPAEVRQDLALIVNSIDIEP